MPIPAFTNGLLPPGVHHATLDEIETRFGLANSTRVERFQGLSKYADLLQSFGLFKGIYVDGSFTTDKPVPNDIDVVVDVDASSLLALLGKPNRNDVLDAKAVKNQYGIHQFFAPTAGGMINFFQHLRPEEAIMRKVPIVTARGILRVAL